ncbi:exported protein (hyp15) [Plasmodium gaboni]|uniref:Exported protein (Hyp15) n=1 Tax=Plasmodium gaboni TaxID=647221 RepID=A0A151L3Z8_9APIC|nr:exported protein (hyp15) [Plasmodium gaboni]KYN93664.1 exported protein (hyp15) [Plasmodium gaboni]
MNKSYFRIYLYNFIILIVSLKFKSYYKKGAYDNGNYNNIYLDKYTRILSQHITDEPLHNRLSTLNVQSSKRVNNEDRVVCKLNDKTVDNKMLDEKNMIGYNILNDKLNKEYDKYHKKNASLKRNKKKVTKKDVLYKMIFKGKTFWNVLKNVITGLGFTSVISCIVWAILCILKLNDVAIYLAMVSGGTVLLIILFCVISWLLVTWLWPYKDEYNRKHNK